MLTCNTIRVCEEETRLPCAFLHYCQYNLLLHKVGIHPRRLGLGEE
jgi:hypothetical protein